PRLRDDDSRPDPRDLRDGSPAGRQPHHAGHDRPRRAAAHLRNAVHALRDVVRHGVEQGPPLSLGRQAALGAGACVVGVVVAATLPSPIAAGARHVFSQVTPTRFLAALGLVFVLSALIGRRSGEPAGHDRPLPAVAWVAAVAGAAGVVWYALGRAVGVPPVFADRPSHGQAAGDVAMHGSLVTHGYGVITPLIDSTAYLLTSNDVTAYRAVQAINVVVMVSSALVAYPLARRALTPRWALAVAAVTPLVPW